MKASAYFVVLITFAFAASCSIRRPAQAESQRAEIEDLYRAARHVDAEIATGVTFDRYRQVVADLDASLLIAQDSAQMEKTHSELIQKYTDMVLAHQDAVYVWSLGLSDPVAHATDARLIQIQQKYGISIGADRTGSLYDYVRNRIGISSWRTKKTSFPYSRPRSRQGCEGFCAVVTSQI